MKRRTFAAAAVAATCLAGPTAWAQADYPSRPIRIITPFGTGTASDALLRGLARKLGDQLGQPVVVENREGASGTIGTRAVATAPADGYTLLFAVSPPFAVTPLLQKASTYDPVHEFTPVARVAEVPMVLVASRNAPFSTFAELTAYARAHPGKVDYAAAGIGVPSHLFMEQVKQLLGLHLTFIPYKSTSQMYTDVVAGQVPLAMVALGAARPQVEAGAWRALAVGSAERHPALPSVPTIHEVVPGGQLKRLSIWFGVLGPHGLPAALVARLQTEIDKAARSPEFDTVLKGQFADLSVQNAAEFGAALASEYAANQRLIRALNLRAAN